MVVDKSQKRVRRMFGEIARRYDFLNHLLSLNVDRYWRWRTVRLVAPQGDAPILDLCTGTGDLALAFAKATGGKTPIVGADFCRPMLLLAHDKGARYQQRSQNGTPQAALQFVEADAQQLPFPDNHFQIVSVAFGLRNVSDTDQGLREMTRVCQPGGRVAVLEFSHPRWEPFRTLYSWYFRYVLPRIGQALASNAHEAYHYLPQSVGEFPSGDAMLQRMHAAGLHNARYYPFTLGVATLYVGVK